MSPAFGWRIDSPSDRCSRVTRSEGEGDCPETPQVQRNEAARLVEYLVKETMIEESRYEHMTNKRKQYTSEFKLIHYRKLSI